MRLKILWNKGEMTWRIFVKDALRASISLTNVIGGIDASLAGLSNPVSLTAKL